MSNSFVTLAEVLEARGSPMDDDEIWALLLQAAEVLQENALQGFPFHSILSPWSVLLSARGGLTFRSNVSGADIYTFAAPELLQGRSSSSQLGIEKMHLYSLGMTLYWAADYHLPETQPVQLSGQLNQLLLSMCEDLPHKRVSLETIVNTCETHRQNLGLPPASTCLRKLVQLVLGSTAEVQKEDSVTNQPDRSTVIRERLHRKQNPELAAVTRRINNHKGSWHQQKVWRAENRSSLASHCQAPTDRSLSTLSTSSSGIQQESELSLSAASYLETELLNEAKNSPQRAVSVACSLQQKGKRYFGPEFVKAAGDPAMPLDLPGSIVSKKGKAHLSQRELSVIIPNGQCLEVKCDVKSKGSDVFDMVVAYTNLVEHFYFGLAYLKDKEFFFLDHFTKLYKVAPSGWKDQSKKRTTIVNFTLFLRIKFFIENFSLIQHSLTRHQYYLQLRKDILEERLYCSDETALLLASLALQAEYGDYISEVHGKNYYRVEHYIPPSVMEKMALTCIKEELPRLHSTYFNLSEEEAELEFLKVTQQLPEYGVLFHRVARDKKATGGEVVLGICAKGIIVYEVKNNSRIASLRFQWRETERITFNRKKFTVQSNSDGKKHTFVTENSKTCKYLIELCSAQHKFQMQMNSRQLYQTTFQNEEHVFTSVASNETRYARRRRFEEMRNISRSETVLSHPNVDTASIGALSKSCDNLMATMATPGGTNYMWSRTADVPQSEILTSSRERCRYLDLQNVTPGQSDVTGASENKLDTEMTIPEREIVFVTLKKDPKVGFGFQIVGGERTGKLDLGIFITSITPGGPADKDGRVKEGGRLISVNKESLEGVTFRTAAEILQNAPDEVTLIISQPKDPHKTTWMGAANLRSKVSSSVSSQHRRHGNSSAREQGLNHEVCAPEVTPVMGGPSDHIHFVKKKMPQELKPGDRYSVELTKIDGSLGVSVTGGVNTSVKNGGIYVKAIIPGGAADCNGHIRKGDRLWEVDGVSLQDITHKQAIECLKNTGQVVRLVFERGQEASAGTPSSEGHQGPIRTDSQHRKQEEYPNDSMATTLSAPKDYSFMTDGNTFEVTMKKNSAGLGFSFLQMYPADSDPGGSLVRIKRLFPGQPAEETGQIEIGDVILAVNRTPLKGLSYQEVLHLLRGAPPEVTMRMCRPAPGTLPDIDPNLLTPVSSPVKELSVLNTIDPQLIRGFEPDEGEEKPRGFPQQDHPWDSSDEEGTGEVIQESTEQHFQDIPLDTPNMELISALAEDLRQNCYSTCDLDVAAPSTESLPCCVAEERDSMSPVFFYKPEVSSPTPLDEEYLTISSTSNSSRCDSPDSQSPTVAVPQLHFLTPFPEPSVPAEKDTLDKTEWEDLEELDPEVEAGARNDEDEEEVPNLVSVARRASAK